MDKDLLKALGYNDQTLIKMEKWESAVKEYFKDDKDYENRVESYYQADYKRGIIAFRDDCPKNITYELNEIFRSIFDASDN